MKSGFTPSQPQSSLQGALCILGAALLFGFMSAGVKLSSESLPQSMVVFGRNLFGLLALLPWIALQRPMTIKTRRLPMHLLRAFFGLGSMYCFFYAVGHMPLSNAVLLQMCMPLFIPFIARLWLKERVVLPVYFALALGFAGTVCVLQPGSQPLNPAALAGVVSAVMGAMVMTSTRRMSDTESTTCIVFYFGLTATLVSAVPAILQWVPPSPKLWLVLMGMGVAATSGLLLTTRAYALAPTAQNGALQYTNVLFAILMGWVFWGESLNSMTLLGSILICSGGILAALSSHMRQVVLFVMGRGRDAG